jgi:ubiquinone/menaquinone biosynthesis C-methylase UbiE
MSHTDQPDIETSSDNYARRFAGETGSYFLATQQEIVLSFLPQNPAPLKILEVGGGHGQLTPALLAAGHQVVVHGSSPACRERIASLLHDNPEQLSFTTADLCNLPFAAQSFDVVTALRLLPHILHTEAFIAQLCKLSKSQVIFDYAPLAGFNVLTPLLFPIKKMIEKNTREYFCHTERYLGGILEKQGFAAVATEGQFVIPMGIHRALKNVSLSRKAEDLLRSLHLHDWLGAPRILSARR